MECCPLLPTCLSSVILLQLRLLPAGQGSCHCWLMEGHLAPWDLLLLCMYTIQSSTLSTSLECLILLWDISLLCPGCSSSPLFRACQFFHKLVGFLGVFSAGFLRYLGIVLQSMSHLLFSCLFFNLLVGFSVKFCTFSRILLFFISLCLSHSFSMLSVTQGFFAGRCLPRMLLAVSVTAVLTLLIKASISVSWFSRARRGANYPPIVAWKISAMFGSLSFSRLNLNLMLPWFLTLLRRSLDIITCSWSLPMSALGKLLVFAIFTLDWKRRLTMM